jgi:inorganic pyrophosphatase
MKNFWDKIDHILMTSEIVIDRPKGSKHPKYPDFIYPLDYGYLKGTTSSDGAEIDIWRGTQDEVTTEAIVCTVDVKKNDTEMKILVGCTDDEMMMILNFHNSSDYMAAILIERE